MDDEIEIIPFHEKIEVVLLIEKIDTHNGMNLVDLTENAEEE